MANQTILVQEAPRMTTQLIEIPVTVNGVQKVRLPDVQQLRSQQGQIIILQGMRFISPKVLTNGMTVSGTNITLAEARKICLVLYSEGWERGQMIPLLTMNDQNDSDATTATTIPFRNMSMKFNDWRNVDWAQSFLLYGNGLVSAGAPYVVMFDVDYLKLDAKGQPILVPS